MIPEKELSKKKGRNGPLLPITKGFRGGNPFSENVAILSQAKEMHAGVPATGRNNCTVESDG